MTAVVQFTRWYTVNLKEDLHGLLTRYCDHPPVFLLFFQMLAIQRLRSWIISLIYYQQSAVSTLRREQSGHNVILEATPGRLPQSIRRRCGQIFDVSRFSMCPVEA